MRFKEFLQEMTDSERYDFSPWHEHDLIERDVTLTDGSKVTLRLYVQYRDGFAKSLDFGIRHHEKRPSVANQIHVFYNDPIETESIPFEDQSQYMPPLDRKLQAAFDKVAAALSKAHIRTVQNVFSTVASAQLKRLMHGDMFKSMFDGDDDDLKKKLGETFEPKDDDIVLKDKILDVSCGFKTDYTTRIFIRMTRNRKLSFLIGATAATRTHTYGFGIQELAFNAEELRFPYDPQHYFVLHSIEILTDEQVEKIFDNVVREFTKQCNEHTLGLALDTAVDKEQAKIDQLELMKNMFDGDDPELTDKLRKAK